MQHQLGNILGAVGWIDYGYDSRLRVVGPWGILWSMVWVLVLVTRFVVIYSEAWKLGDSMA